MDHHQQKRRHVGNPSHLPPPANQKQSITLEIVARATEEKGKKRDAFRRRTQRTKHKELEKVLATNPTIQFIPQ